VEEILLGVERDQDKFAFALKAMKLALDDNIKVQRTIQRVNAEMEVGIKEMTTFKEKWHEEVEEIKHLVRLGRNGFDLSDLKDKNMAGVREKE